MPGTQDRGKFIISGTPDEMKSSDDPLVKQFINGLTNGPLTERRQADNYLDDLLHAEKDKIDADG